MIIEYTYQHLYLCDRQSPIKQHVTIVWAFFLRCLHDRQWRKWENCYSWSEEKI